MRNGLMLHCGGEQVTREQIDLIWKPEATNTYQPVGHGELIDLAKEVVDYRLGYKIRSEQYGLNKDGMQLFFAITYDTGTDTNGTSTEQNSGFTIAGRNSYDKSLSVGFVGGSRVFVCDNLALTGSSFKVIRKHTKGVLQDVRELCDSAIHNAQQAHLDLTDLWRRMRLVECNLDRGFEIMGRALGHDVVKPQQVTAAMSAWDEDLHGFGRSLFGVYQAFTEGCKRGAANTMIERLTDVNRFMAAELDTVMRVGLPPMTDAGEALLANQPRLMGLEID